MNKQNQDNMTEVIRFQCGDNLAAVVTDGRRFRTYEYENTKLHDTLSRAIAFLEGKGYSIIID